MITSIAPFGAEGFILPNPSQMKSRVKFSKRMFKLKNPCVWILKAVFYYFALLVLLSCAIWASRVSLRNDQVIKTWVETVPKEINLFSILAGDCSLHEEAIQDVYYDWPIHHIQGGPGLYERLTRHLNQSCGVIGSLCGSQVVLIKDAEKTPVYDMKEIIHGFASKKICMTPDFDGLSVDCSRVWVVLSTCLAKELLDPEANELEAQDLSQQQIDAEAWYQVRRTWPGLALSHGSLRIIRNPFESFGSLDTVVSKLIDRLKKTTSTSSIAFEPHAPLISEGIDLSVFNSSGYSGQDWARQAVQKALTAVQRGLKSTNGPIVFLFLGPAGTGKTMLARIIARAYHGGESISTLESRGEFLLLPMGDYKSEEDVDAFVSPRPGLVGDGILISTFSSSSRPVIVLDEFEKANPKLINTMLLSWIDEQGFVQSKKDSTKKFSTKDAIFILTSNCFGTEVAKASTVHQGDAKLISEDVLRFLSSDTRNTKRDAPGCDVLGKDYFLRRMKAGHAMADLSKYGFVVFLPPTPSQVDELVEWFLQDYKRRHEGKSGGFYWTPRALKRLKLIAQRASTSTSGSGGLSYVTSELTGVVTRLMLGALGECRAGSKPDTLLFERNNELQARSVGCKPSSIIPEFLSTADTKVGDVSDKGESKEIQSAVSSSRSDQGKDAQYEIEVAKEVDAAKEITHESDAEEEDEVESWFAYMWNQLWQFGITLALIFIVAFAIQYVPMFSVLPQLLMLLVMPLLGLRYKYPTLFWSLWAIFGQLLRVAFWMSGAVGIWGTFLALVLFFCLPKGMVRSLVAWT